MARDSRNGIKHICEADEDEEKEKLQIAIAAPYAAARILSVNPPFLNVCTHGLIALSLSFKESH